MPVATPEFLDTFTTYENKTKNCFYGTCNYCDPAKGISPICPFADGTVEGVMILILPKKFLDGSKAIISIAESRFPIVAWTNEDKDRMENMKSKDYCDAMVKSEVPIQPRLLDIIETSIFDFLIQNTDRHSYEFISEDNRGGIMLIDHGKSFGLASQENDKMELLTPLIQCCILRKTTYEYFQWLSRMDGTFSDAVLRLTSVDIATPPAIEGEAKEDYTAVLRDGDLVGLDRRMSIILGAMKACIDERGSEEVLVESPLF